MAQKATARKKTVGSTVESAGTRMAERMERAGMRATKRAARAADAAQRTAERNWDRAQERLERADAQFTKFVKENPKRAVMVSAAVGAAIAAALTAMRRKR